MKAAMVFVTSGGPLLEQATAMLNALIQYGNEIDYHVIAHPTCEPAVLESMKANGITIIPWEEIQDSERKEKAGGQEKRTGWECRYYRYRHASRIADQYDVICLTDSDMIYCSNIMGYFEQAHADGLIHMPNNPWGSTDAKVDKVGIECIQGASSPPYHNMPLFIDPKKYSNVLEGVYEWGLREPYGDMATLYRTLFRMGMRDKIEPLDNDLWVVTDWYKYMMTLDYENGLPVIRTKENKQVNSVHRRWNMQEVRDKFIGDIKEDDNRERGVNNVNIFYNVHRFFLNVGPIQWA